MRNLNRQQKLDAMESHKKMVKSGMFWELFPQLSGEWSKDRFEWYTIWLNDFDKVKEAKDKEPRIVIPICKRHGKFQTKNGRWLEIKHDLENHIIYTGSQEAVLSDGECDECVDKSQTRMNFFGMMGNNSGEE